MSTKRLYSCIKIIVCLYEAAFTRQNKVGNFELQTPKIGKLVPSGIKYTSHHNIGHTMSTKRLYSCIKIIVCLYEAAFTRQNKVGNFELQTPKIGKLVPSGIKYTSHHSRSSLIRYFTKVSHITREKSADFDWFKVHKNRLSNRRVCQHRKIRENVGENRDKFYLSACTCLPTVVESFTQVNLGLPTRVW